MISPTVTSRILTLDVLRGVAILGILVANIGAFSAPFENHAKGLYLPIETSPALNNAVIALVVGKFRTILAILFGAGLWLQYQKRKDNRSLWPGGYLKRTFWLMAIGFVHVIVIWYGDILVMYALMAFIATFLVHLNQKTLIQVIAGLTAINVFCGATLSAVMAMMPGDYTLSNSAAYATGTFGDQLADRINLLAIMMVNNVIYIPFFLPLFLLGILLAQTGALATPSKRPKIRNLCLGLGIGLGLPLNLTMLVLNNPSYAVIWELLLGPLLGVGYVMLGAVIIEKRVMEPMLNLIGKVGKVALTTYLMQSIICTAIFYSWGGAQFGKLDALPLLGIVVQVWVINLFFAAIWLQFFAMGPVEWAWRSLTESRVLPIRKKDAIEMEKKALAG